MTAPLLDLASRRARSADAVLKSDETISLTLEASGAGHVTRYAGSWCQLRVQLEGRVGFAGSTTPGSWAAMVDVALEGAARSGPGELRLPEPTPCPIAMTSHPAAAVAGPAEIRQLALILAERLARYGDSVSTWVERSTGTVEVANSLGVLVRYDATLVGLGLQLAPSPEDGAGLQVSHVGVAWPGTSEIEQLCAEVDRRLVPPALNGVPPARSRVCLAPRAVAALLRPLLGALTAGALDPRGAPPGSGLGGRGLPDLVTLRDDPLADRRPGTRPVDDEGVASRTLPLIEAGQIRGVIADLASGARHGVPSTGHARRLPHAPPRPAFSNLIFDAGATPVAALRTQVGDGILVLDLPEVVASGPDAPITLVTPWAFRLADGEAVGRYPPMVLRTTVLDMLERLVAVSDEAFWIGSWRCPSLLFDEVELFSA